MGSATAVEYEIGRFWKVKIRDLLALTKHSTFWDLRITAGATKWQLQGGTQYHQKVADQPD